MREIGDVSSDGSGTRRAASGIQHGRATVDGDFLAIRSGDTTVGRRSAE
jgi:hypothetical protein